MSYLPYTYHVLEQPLLPHAARPYGFLGKLREVTGWLICDLVGTELLPEEQDLLAHPAVAGLILFTRNYENLTQLKALIHECRRVRPNLLITVDQEGGRVQRLREGFTIFPPAQEWGTLYEKNPFHALCRLSQAAELMAKELQACGIDLTFAPVVDLEYGRSEVIGNRSFHTDPFILTRLAKAFVSGLHTAKMPAVMKHFPGHGYVTLDSHLDLPIDSRSFNELAPDLIPFQSLAALGIAGVMPAHVVYEHCDVKPAGFSRYWLQTILRQKLNFQGVIFSDDLSMIGAQKSQGNIINRAIKAYEAGCDYLLVCNDRSAVLELLQ